MKRFYCTVCKKIKRVRRWPASVNPHEIKPDNRVGVCNRHVFETHYSREIKLSKSDKVAV